MLLRSSAYLLVVVGVAGCSTQLPAGSRRPFLPVAAMPAASGWGASEPHTTLASWYGPGFNGRSTSSGETFNSHRLTAASRALPLGSHARVTNLDNGQSVVVRVNDRGPYVRGRGIDLSQAAAERLGFRREGVARVEVTRLDATASAIPLVPERWTGTVRVRRHYHWHHRHRGRSRQFLKNPITTWLLELTR